MVSGRTSYSQALATFDPTAILASLSNEVTIWVAVHDEPLQGKETASFLFGVLTQELAPFKLTEEIVEGDKSAVLFETSLRGHRAHGLNVVTYQPPMGWSDQQLLLFRPLAAMQLIADVIGDHMAQQFGTPPPEGMRSADLLRSPRLAGVRTLNGHRPWFADQDRRSRSPTP